MKKTNKKGFTIVELVIVIAVIAILAAVLIPTFANLIKKANLSSDQVAIRNMNTILAAETAADGKPATLGELRAMLTKNGYAAKVTPATADYQYYWDTQDNLNSLYRNYSELRLVSSAISQNKQYTTYSIAAVQKRIASAVYTACSENKMLVDTLTYAANATVSGVVQLNPKLKNASYLFLDLKDTYARFVFVVNGRAVGSYSLPFGLEFLRKPEVVPEDMLFDHTLAELTVLNAREIAKSKKLTILAPDAMLEDEETDAEETAAEDENTESDGSEDAELTAMAEAVGTGKQPIPKLFKKKVRKLPKFMQREIPESAEGILYENFRIFEKWALTLIEGNEKLTELGKPEFVCVNIPEDIAPVLGKVNEENAGSGISFTALSHGNADSTVTANLELYGGLFPKTIGATGKL